MDVRIDSDKPTAGQRLYVVHESPGDSYKSRTPEEKVGELLDAVDAASKERAIAERRLLRKLDIRFMPTIVLIYIMNYIDRNAVTAARLKGLEKDLHLSDIQYDTIVAILYASFCTAQIPSNMILNRVSRPSLYIGLCVIAWGLTSAMTGVSSFKQLSGVGLYLHWIYRFNCSLTIMLGFSLAGYSLVFPKSAAFYPGTIYLLSRWYTRKELAFRTSILFAGAMCSNAFGNLMAAGILSNMEGKRGIRGWRWLFFIEGAITITIGILALWSLPDLPINTRWMSNSERRLAQARLSEDAGEANEDLAQDSMWSGFRMAIKDVKVLIFSVMVLSMFVGLSFTNFFPTLTSTLGYNTTITLLLAAPPWIWAAVVSCLNGRNADKTGERFFHVCHTWWGVMVGYIIALSTFSVGGRYVSLFLMASGHAGYVVALVWVSNTIARPPAKRAAAIGIVNGIGNTGNLIGSYAWRADWGPQYHQSMEIGIAALAFSSFLAFVMRCILKHMNTKLDEDELGALKGANRERVENAARLEGITMEEAKERKKGFRYLY